MSELFEVIADSGRVGYTKPDPRIFRYALKAVKAGPKEAVFVGDSAIDVQAARAADIPVIAMSYGYTPVPANELGADAVLDDFAELPETIFRLVR